VLASSLIQAFISDEVFARVLPRRAAPAAVVGSLLGLAFPVCDCGAIPVSRRLLSKGAPLPTAIAFMLAAPVINPVVLVATWVAFGANPRLALGRFALILFVAVAVALVFSRHAKPTELLASGIFTRVRHDHEQRVGSGKLGQIAHNATDEFFEMGRFLVLGALIGAAIQTLVPREVLLGIGQTPALSVLTLMALAAVLSVCSTVDAFVALSLASTFSTGAILAFLAFGPMVDLKSVFMYTTTVRRGPLLLLIALCGQLIFLVAAFVNLNFG
jgi:uncharacterized membrane protein YraQ (UPF0718 family)